MGTMFGKTIFSRIFIINIISVLVCIIILGSMQTVLVTNYISRAERGGSGKKRGFHCGPDPEQYHHG